MRAEANSGGDFELPPEGMHLARCIKVIDLGTQEQKFKDNVNKQHQVFVMFELPKVLIDVDGEQKPQAISKKYNLSFNSKATFRKDLESWYGRKFKDKDIQESGGFDPSKILGKPATLTVAHSDDGNYANIASVTGVMEGVEVPEQVNPSVLFDLDDFDRDIWDSFSEKMQAWILKSPEAQAAVYGQSMNQDRPAESIADSDLPF